MKTLRTPTNKEILERVRDRKQKENGVYRDDYYISKRKLRSILEEIYQEVVEETSAKDRAKKLLEIKKSKCQN